MAHSVQRDGRAPPLDSKATRGPGRRIEKRVALQDGAVALLQTRACIRTQFLRSADQEGKLGRAKAVRMIRVWSLFLRTAVAVSTASRSCGRG
eukprot:3198702-Prymnesium_polylepis.2